MGRIDKILSGGNVFVGVVGGEERQVVCKLLLGLVLSANIDRFLTRLPLGMEMGVPQLAQR